MNEVEILELTRQGVIVLVTICMPPLMTGLVIGLMIALFQALTSIQEMTLTFVPKIIAVFLSLIVFLPMMIAELKDFTQLVMDRAINLQ